MRSVSPDWLRATSGYCRRSPKAGGRSNWPIRCRARCVPFGAVSSGFGASVLTHHLRSSSGRGGIGMGVSLPVAAAPSDTVSAVGSDDDGGGSTGSGAVECAVGGFANPSPESFAHRGQAMVERAEARRHHRRSTPRVLLSSSRSKRSTARVPFLRIFPSYSSRPDHDALPY